MEATHQSKSRFCVCGRSAQFPICDGSHREEEWSCADDVERAQFGFAASRCYANLALKLASHYDGVLCRPGETLAAVDRLVLIVDVCDLEWPQHVARAVSAGSTLVVAMGQSPGLLVPLFQDAGFLDLSDVTPVAAFARVRRLLDGGEPAAGLVPRRLRSVFISHAVRDEPQILPVISYIKRFYFAEMFVCADSIPGGSEWMQAIDSSLRQMDCFIGLLSAASVESQFCSFEVGVASGLSKPIYLISLDGSAPPGFLQQIQVADLPRLQRQRPWLDTRDLLLEQLLLSMVEPGDPPAGAAK